MCQSNCHNDFFFILSVGIKKVDCICYNCFVFVYLFFEMLRALLCAILNSFTNFLECTEMNKGKRKHIKELSSGLVEGPHWDL